MKTLSTTLLIALLSTTAFADNSQNNVATQNTTNVNTQIGNDNVSVINSSQTQAQLNAASSAGNGFNAQGNAAAQGALNANTQLGNGNVSVIDNVQKILQANKAITAPAF